MSGTKESRVSQLFLMIGNLLCILITAGCISPSSAPVPQPGNISLPATTVSPVTPPIIVPAPVHCQNGSNTSYTGEQFIQINSVPHHYIGDTITFDGSTNLPPGEMITLGVYSADFMPCPKWQCSGSVHPCCGGIGTTIAVIPGICCINTWSWDVNTSQYGFQADHQYFVSASGREGLVENTSFFTVSGIPKPNITFNLPENDPNEYAIRFSGQVNTGNGPDEILLLKISSDSGAKVSYTIPAFLNGTGYYWNFTLKKSAITPYNFYTVNITSLTNPEIGYRNTFMYSNLPQYYSS
jgi:hypothetical protein